MTDHFDHTSVVLARENRHEHIVFCVTGSAEDGDVACITPAAGRDKMEGSIVWILALIKKEETK